MHTGVLIGKMKMQRSDLGPKDYTSFSKRTTNCGDGTRQRDLFGGSQLWDSDQEIYGGNEWKMRVVFVGLFVQIHLGVQLTISSDKDVFSWCQEARFFMGNLMTCF